MLGRVCASDHGFHLRIPMRSIQTPEIWKQLRISDVGRGDRRLSQFVIHDLDPRLRRILRGRNTRIHQREYSEGFETEHKVASKITEGGEIGSDTNVGEQRRIDHEEQQFPQSNMIAVKNRFLISLLGCN